MRTRNHFLVLLLAFALVAEGCVKTEEITPDPVETAIATDQTAPVPMAYSVDQVVVLTANGLTTLDPYRMATIHPEDSIAAHLWDTLVWLNDDLELEPHLAESWWLVNDLTWELEIRQDVTFHNGEPFDAQAVKFSLERTRLLENSLETFASDVALQSVEIIDDYTVHIHTAMPAASLIYELSAVEMLPPIYYAQTTLEDLARNPVGSGPYQLADWNPGESVIMEASADYWQGMPAIRTLIFQVEPDVDERLAQLADGNADLITDLPPDQAEAANTERTQMLAIESTRRLFVGLRFQESTPVADKRFRQALNYAIDVQALIDEFHAGYGQRYGSWVNPPNANPDLEPWPYDPDKARDLLAQAGYPEEFEIAMDTPVGRYHRDQEIAEAIAAQLAKVGIRVAVQPQEWSVYVSERLVPKETAPLFLLSLVSRGNGLEDIRNLAYDFPFNPTLWHNEEFEQLLDQAGEAFNQTVRLNRLYHIQTVAYEEAPWIWLWRPYLFYGVNQDLDWWQPRADGLVYLHHSPAPGTAK
ncbi:MAG: ABC transporter substrate-binding protein [Chloroflexota bacterium]|nr:ABC transporter substrate-binding protein [Chloroflexota bacterium]